MSPFQQFRLWLRRAPLGERAGAGVGAALAVAAVAWLLVPSSNHQNGNNVGVAGGPNASVGATSTGAGGGSSLRSTIGGSTPGGNGGSAGATGGSVAGGGSSGLTGGSGGSSGSGSGNSGSGTSRGSGGGTGPQTPAGGGGSGCVSGSDQGVTSHQIKIAILLVNVAGAASTTVGGYPTPQVQQQYFQQVLDSANASGGADCRKLVADFYSPNVADQAELQQTCLSVEQGGYFAVLDVGSYFLFPSLATCFPNSHIPYFGGAILPQSEQQQYYPYLFGGGVAESNYRNAVYGLQQQGFFSPAKGFSKLGLVYRDCEPQYLAAYKSYLAQAGVPNSKIDAFDLGCSPALYAPPSEVEQAVLQFEGDHVHNVTFINDVNDFANFTSIANQQGFHPWYGSPDDGEVAASSGNGGYNYQNMNHMIAISGERYGEESTVGMSPTAGTSQCAAIYGRYGEPSPYKQLDGAGGVSCDMVWELVAAIDHAPILQRNALAAGLQAAKSVEFSYPWGPNDFTGYHWTTGGRFWRPVEFFASCTCWHVLDPTFHPAVSSA